MSAEPEAQAAVQTPQWTRKVYRSGGGRRAIFMFVFLVLLPFFLSLPGMLFMRLKHGHTADSIGLAVFALAFAALMYLLLIELMFTIRARVELGEDKVRMTLPSARGPSPLLSYVSHEVPYDQVTTVETRREIYGGSVLPVMLKGARLTLKDGSQVRLGYVSEANVDPAFPYPEIAAQIAERSRLPLIDRGNVRRSFRSKMLGLRLAPRAGSEAVDEAQIADLNRSHSNVMLGLIGGLVVLMVIGLVEDFSVRTAESRATAPTAGGTPPKPAGQVPAR